VADRRSRRGAVAATADTPLGGLGRARAAADRHRALHGRRLHAGPLGAARRHHGRGGARRRPAALSWPCVGHSRRRGRRRRGLAPPVTAVTAPTVAVIGLGFGRAHVPGFQSAGARVVAVCQRDEAAARTVAGAYGVPHAYGRWEDMLATEHPDIVVIATPPHLHRTIARAAAAGGAHVLCEKPLATAREDAEAIVADVARAGRVGMTGFNWRFPAAMQRMRALMAEGAIGRVLHVRAD